MAMNQATNRLEGYEAKCLGDHRRAVRMAGMVETLIRRPSGKVCEVFRDDAERQAAYDFLEHATVRAEAVQEIAAIQTARRCVGQKSVLAVLDGSSLSLTDEGGTKGFGSVGPREKGASGLKVINVLAVTPTGQTVGVLAQEFWARGAAAERGYRPLHDRESYRWHLALDRAYAVMKKWSPETRLHALVDREGDATLLIKHLTELDCDFTVRANGTRKVLVGGRRVLLRPLLKKQAVIARYTVAVEDTERSPARVATLAVRAARVQMVLRDRHVGERSVRELTVIWAREENAPRGATPLDWLLYTTVPVRTAREALEGVVRYGYRWRIEDFHKMLKSGGGCVEDSQLRSVAAVIKWATLHAMVAGRAQRLRDASRTSPEVPASVEFTEAEIEALVLLKTAEKRRTETITADGLTLARAVRWTADLGGFAATGVSKKLPGATVIGRGLERVVDMVHIVAALRAAGKMR